MRDDTALIRQLLLLRALGARRHGMSLREMADEMGVGPKTITRDLGRFVRIGVRLVESNGERGRKTWRLSDNGRMPPLSLTYDETVVLYLGRRLLSPLAGTSLWDATQSAMRKIRATLGEQALQYLDEMCPRLFHSTRFGFVDYSGKAEIIDDLSVAIEDFKAVHITYQSRQATEAATRDVYPYSLTWHKTALYLVAFSPEHDKFRNYKVNRIEAVEGSAITFQRQPDFDISQHLARSFGIYDGDDDVSVVIKFLPGVARYVREATWHGSQTLTTQRDGSLLATFRLSSTVEIKSWVLGFGPNATVLEPASLRAEIAADLEQSIRAYQELAVRS
jgi:predicted DNA-binding transcriptional regulator YafY